MNGLNEIHHKLGLEPDCVKEELAEILKTDEKYKFKDVASIQVEIEKTLYSILLKVQRYSVESEVHKICVKFFLLKGKFILALKSMSLLQKRHSTSYDYLISLNKFINYTKDTKNTIPEDYLNLAYTIVDFKEGNKVLQDAKVKVLGAEKNPILLATLKLKINRMFKLFGKSANFGPIMKDLNKATKEELRTTKQSVLIYI